MKFCQIILSLSVVCAWQSGHSQNHAKPRAKKEVSKAHHDEKEKAEESEHDDDHDHQDKDANHKKGHEEDGHGHGDENEHGEEGESVVGPDKGILKASEKDGIQLSAEAEKNFEILRKPLGKANAIEIPKSAVVRAGMEINVYRYRNGFYKRIDFESVQSTGSIIQLRSKELKSGDEIVIRGMGFLRLAEIAAFGGAPEGHSH